MLYDIYFKTSGLDFGEVISGNPETISNIKESHSIGSNSEKKKDKKDKHKLKLVKKSKQTEKDTDTSKVESKGKKLYFCYFSTYFVH